MLDKMKIVNGALILALVYDLRNARKNRMKYEEILEENTIIQKNFTHAQFMVGYLAKKLEENEIELDEFDLIALNNLM